MRSATAIALLVSAVVVLMAAVPLASADTHPVVKGAKGPSESAVTWVYMTGSDIGLWYGYIENNGLRSLVVEVADNSTGTPVGISHERIRFAAFDAYPIGTLNTTPVVLGANRIYDITVTPNGPRDSSCTVMDQFIAAEPPVAEFSAAVVGATVSVDASASDDSDGYIVSYAWDFGDGGTATTMLASHTYTLGGTYTVTLVVTDDDDLWTAVSQEVIIADNPPVAAFTVTIEGAMAIVDASGSSDDFGIVSYAWSWGDGASSTGMAASHNYSLGGSVAAPVGGGRAPMPPYYVLGYCTNEIGAPVVGATVVITNLRTGGYNTTLTLDNGLYALDINNELPGSWLAGDTLTIEATSGLMSGSGEILLTGEGAYVRVDIAMSGGMAAHEFTITLTVTDGLGQIATASELVILYY